MIGPAARLAGRVHVGAAEEIGLHVHLLDLELAGLDPLVDVLVARVEAADVAAHARSTPVSFCTRDERSRFGERVGDRNLDQHVLAGAHALARPARHAPGSGVARITASTPGLLQASARSVVQCGILNSSATALVASGRPPASETTSTPAMFAIASRCFMPNAPWPASSDLHVELPIPRAFSRIMWPTAVFEAGT